MQAAIISKYLQLYNMLNNTSRNVCSRAMAKHFRTTLFRWWRGAADSNRHLFSEVCCCLHLLQIYILPYRNTHIAIRFFSVILHLFLSFSPCIHFKFQMALMSLGCSSSSICCVSVFAVKEMGKFKRGRVAALDTFIKMLHVSRLNLYKQFVELL